MNERTNERTTIPDDQCRARVSAAYIVGVCAAAAMRLVNVYSEYVSAFISAFHCMDAQMISLLSLPIALACAVTGCSTFIDRWMYPG